MALEIVILAAGKGKRMQANTSKVLLPLAGKPLLQHVLNTACSLNPAAIHIIYGHCGKQVREEFANYSPTVHIHWIKQHEQLGTGHAVLQALPFIKPTADVLILYGDVPLIPTKLLNDLLTITSEIGIITTELKNPTGYGRILRDEQNQLTGIAEEKDASEIQQKIKEINSGIVCSKAANLNNWLKKITVHNNQGEYYLTDIIGLAVKNNVPVKVIKHSEFEQLLGVNDHAQLAFLERYYQQQLAHQLMLQGIRILDAHRLDIRGELSAAAGVTIDINVIIEGTVSLGTGTFLGPHSLVRNSKIGNNVIIKANSIIEDAIIGDGCIIGPFARIRPNTQLAEGVHIGNFVEIKNSQINPGSKINHLSYIGDAIVGERVNIGAGTITCNYDGVKKHTTVIEDECFIGSGTELVAPINLGKGAFIGAGSTLTEDAPAHELTLARSQQRTIHGWQNPIQHHYKEDE